MLWVKLSKWGAQMRDFLRYAATVILALVPTLALAQVNATVMNDDGPFAEGVLSGYIVQHQGRVICENPVAWGKYIACSGKASKRVWVDTNGTLGAYVVVDKSGKELCTNPSVSIQFRGPKSYIICD